MKSLRSGLKVPKVLGSGTKVFRVFWDLAPRSSKSLRSGPQSLESLSDLAPKSYLLLCLINSMNI